MARAWVLNFDGDDELAAPERYKAPTAAVAARFEALAARVGPLLGPDDRVMAPGGRGDGHGCEGWAFCATPGARRALEVAGATPVPVPPVEVVRAVNHRAFAAGLGLGAPESRYVQNARDVAAHLATGLGRDWLLKRAFGFAGRGRRKVRGVLTGDEERWVDASLRSGEGLVVEPWVSIARDVALHGWLSPAGVASFGCLTVQSCTAEGAWLGSRRAGDGELPDEEMDAMARAGARVAEALAAAGYFGAFGIDGYGVARESGGGFVAVSDLNARFSMGWATGFGGPPPANGARVEDGFRAAGSLPLSGTRARKG